MNIFIMILPLFCSIVLCWIAALLVVSEADKDRPARETESGRIEFLPNRRSYWGIYVIIAVLSYPIAAGFISAVGSGTGAWLVSLCMGFILLLLISFPGSIILTAEGLEQNYWVGRRKRIAWNDVVGFEIDKKGKKVTIRAKNGPKIVHTRQLPDRERLMTELEIHCPGNVLAGNAKKPVAPPVGKLENT
ncbi:MAG: hypothetical protein WCA11_05685 [Terracidiphilus sp.]